MSHKAHIPVNESLLTCRKRLLGRVLEFKPKHNYKFVRTANGKILLKKTENSTTKCFVTKEEFVELLDQCGQLTDFIFTTPITDVYKAGMQVNMAGYQGR